MATYDALIAAWPSVPGSVCERLAKLNSAGCMPWPINEHDLVAAGIITHQDAYDMGMLGSPDPEFCGGQPPQEAQAE